MAIPPPEVPEAAEVSEHATQPAGRRLARIGVLAATASRLFGRLAGILFVVVLARVSSDETVAVYGYLLGTATLVVTLTDVGVAAVAGRDVAAGHYDAGAGLAAALPAQLASVLLAWVVTLVLIVLSGPPGVDATRTGLVLLFLALNGLVNLWGELLRGQGRVVAEALLQILSALLLVGSGLVVVALGGDATPLLAVVAGKELVILAISWWLIRPRRTSEVQTRNLLHHGFVVAVASTALVAMWRQGMVHVGAVGSLSAVATYVVAARFLDTGTTFANTIGFGLLPGAASLHEDRAGFRALARRSLGLSAAAGLAVSVLGVLLAGPLVHLLFSERWEAAIPVVRVFALAGLPILVAYIAWFLLLAAYDQRWLAIAATLALVVGTTTTILTGRSTDAELASAIGTTAGGWVLGVVLVVRLAVVLTRRTAFSPAPR